MREDSQIDVQTVAAYRRTQYRISEHFSLWIDEHSIELASWQARHAVHCSVFISAVNPHSKVLSHHENRARHERLRTRLEREGLSFVAGAGLAPDRLWPEEPGFLVAGVDQLHACRLGDEFHQNAVVWSGPDAVPRLLLLR